MTRTVPTDSNAVATRTLRYSNPNHPNRNSITVTIRVPQKSDVFQQWDCQYEIVYSDGDTVQHMIHGEDSMQALILTIQVIRGYIDSLLADGATLEWLGSANAGFPRVIFD